MVEGGRWLKKNIFRITFFVCVGTYAMNFCVLCVCVCVRVRVCVCCLCVCVSCKIVLFVCLLACIGPHLTSTLKNTWNFSLPITTGPGKCAKKQRKERKKHT